MVMTEQHSDAWLDNHSAKSENRSHFADEKFELALDLHEQMQEFILNNGPKYILPYLNRADKQKAS